MSYILNYFKELIEIENFNQALNVLPAIVAAANITPRAKLNSGGFEHYQFKSQHQKPGKASHSNVLVIGDSLTLKREKPEVLPPEQTWPFLLHSARNCDVEVISAYGATSSYCIEEILPFFESKAKKNYSFCIFQLGLVDCALRPFTISEELALKKFDIKISSESRYKLRSMRQIQFCDIKTFEKNVTTLKNRLEYYCEQVCCISIFKAHTILAEQSPQHNFQAMQYNRILDQIFKSSNLNCELDPEKDLMSDDQHLSAIGSLKLSKQIDQQILSI